jgi:microcystin degradation protein MlrC
MVIDPEAAQACAQAGVGRSVTIEIGHKLDPAWGTPLRATGTVQRLSPISKRRTSKPI